MKVNKERESKLTHGRLKEVLSYDIDDGTFTWLKKAPNNMTVGNIAGGVHKYYGYRIISIGGEQYRAHRLAFLYMTGSWPKDQVDHINGSREDNRWCNLREVTNKENHRNRKLNRNNSSGLLGVYWDKEYSKWWVTIVVEGVRKHLGRFTNKEDAIQARREANIKYGFHENHGRSNEATENQTAPTVRAGT